MKKDVSKNISPPPSSATKPGVPYAPGVYYAPNVFILLKTSDTETLAEHVNSDFRDTIGCLPVFRTKEQAEKRFPGVRISLVHVPGEQN